MRFRRAWVVAGVVVPAVVAAVVVSTLGTAGERAKDVAVPTGWETAWQSAHVLEGEDVVLAWGDRAGEDPRGAETGMRFDPASAVARLDSYYDADVRRLAVAHEQGTIGRHKVVVVVDGTWDAGPGIPDASPEQAPGGLSGATRGATGSVVDGVGLVRAQPSALAGDGRPAWELARGFAEAVQDFVVADGAGFDRTDDGGFWQASAAYLATVSSGQGIGDPSDLVRAPSLPWASARQGDAGWLLLEYLSERDGDDLVGRLWRGARPGEAPLDAYVRLTGVSADSLDRRVAEYALRTVTWAFGGSVTVADHLDDVDPVLLAGRSTPVTAVADDPGRYQVLDGFAPSAFGFGLVRLVPDASIGTVRVHLRGHAEVPGAGWSVGFVALRDGVPRYSPVVEGADDLLEFPLREGEDEVYLVVVGTPSTPSAGGTTFGAATRYPYEFRISGATVADDTAAAPAPGGHRHANGGGWVEDTADVDATAYVGPGAVVRGDAKVLGSARLEGRAWVEGGAVVQDQAVVRDMAVVRGSARLGGNVVVGGDAVVDFTCTAGGYTAYDPARTCDGRTGAPDVNAPVTPFTAADVALEAAPDVTTPPESTTGEPPATDPPGQGGAGGPGQGTTEPGGTGVTAPPATQPTTPPRSAPTSGAVDPPAPVPAGACSATYTIQTTWVVGGTQPYFQAQVDVQAGAGGVGAWSVRWTLPPGQAFTTVWNAQLGTSGSSVTAESMSYNGTLREGEHAIFGLQGTAPTLEAATVVPQLTCTKTR